MQKSLVAELRIKFALPVSKVAETLCGGVPTVKLMKYWKPSCEELLEKKMWIGNATYKYCSHIQTDSISFEQLWCCASNK